MKKIISFVLIFMTLSTASANTGAGLKAAFDDLDLALTVEWDQQDQNFYDDHLKIFEERIVQARSEGLTNEAMINFTLSQIKNERVAQDFLEIIPNLKLNQLSDAEAMQTVREILEKSRTEGAAWNGSTTVISAAVIVLVGVTVFAVVKGKVKVRGWDPEKKQE